MVQPLSAISTCDVMCVEEHVVWHQPAYSVYIHASPANSIQVMYVSAIAFFLLCPSDSVELFTGSYSGREGVRGSAGTARGAVAHVGVPSRWGRGSPRGLAGVLDVMPGKVLHPRKF